MINRIKEENVLVPPFVKGGILKPFLILFLTFVLPSGNLSSADRGQNIGSEWKSIGKEIKQGTKDWVDEMLKYPESLGDNMRLIVPEDTSTYLSDFQIGGAMSLPPGIGFTGTLQEEASLDIGIDPILGCGSLNSLASVKNSFKDTAVNAPRKLLTFAASAAKSLITGLPMLMLAYASPTTYEYLTNELGISLTGFFSGEFPSCQDMQDGIDAALKESAEKAESEKRTAVKEAAIGTLKKGVMSSIGVKWKAKGKEGSWSSEEYTQEKLEEEAKKGYFSVDENGNDRQAGGENQGSLDLVETAINAGFRIYLRAINTKETTHFGLFGDFGQFRDSTGRINRHLLKKIIVQLVGNQVISYNPEAKNKMNIKATPALGIEGLEYETAQNATKALLTIVKDLNDKSKSIPVKAKDTDVHKLITLSGGPSGFTPQLLDILAKGFREGDREVMWQFQAFAYVLGRYKLINYVSPIHALLNLAQTSQAGVKNELFSTWNAAAISSLERIQELLKMSSREELDREFNNTVRVIIARDEEKQHTYRKP